MDFTIHPGFFEHHRSDAACAFWQAFRGKFEGLLGPEDAALAFLHEVLDPSHAVSAVASDGRFLGMAGYKTSEGALIGGTVLQLMRIYGVRALWRAPLLALLERDVQAGTLLMDGIFVSDDARGLGVGTALLTAVKSAAQQRHCPHVRLDVIDSNPRARALYERQGFVAEGETVTGIFAPVLGFRSATKMVWTQPA